MADGAGSAQGFTDKLQKVTTDRNPGKNISEKIQQKHQNICSVCTSLSCCVVVDHSVVCCVVVDHSVQDGLRGTAGH